MGNAGNWPSTNVTLLHRLRDANDSEGWDEFWSIYSPLIYRFCLRRFVQHEDALDVRQNAMIALRSGLTTFDPAKGKFRGWFGMLIRREIAKHRERQARHGQAIGGEFDVGDRLEAEDTEWDAEFKAHIVEVALERIKPEFEPIELIVMEQVVLRNLKPRDLVAEIGRDAAWISRVKYRLIQRLKAEVQYLSDSGLD